MTDLKEQKIGDYYNKQGEKISVRTVTDNDNRLAGTRSTTFRKDGGVEYAQTPNTGADGPINPAFTAEAYSVEKNGKVTKSEYSNSKIKNVNRVEFKNEAICHEMEMFCEEGDYLVTFDKDKKMTIQEFGGKGYHERTKERFPELYEKAELVHAEALIRAKTVTQKEKATPELSVNNETISGNLKAPLIAANSPPPGRDRQQAQI